MKTYGKTWYIPHSAPALCAVAVFIFIISPVVATLALTDVSFSPKPPMVPAQPQNISATIWIIPSGATTFASTHALQLQTPLENARWDIQVIVDGRTAAHQTALGRTAFINGEVISYPTPRDVTFVITIAGTVPENAGPSLVVMQADEINTNGIIVPGNTITITQPTTVSTGTSIIPTVPPITPLKTTSPTPSPTRAPGFSFFGGISALCIVPVVTMGYYSRERRHK